MISKKGVELKLILQKIQLTVSIFQCFGQYCRVISYPSKFLMKSNDFIVINYDLSMGNYVKCTKLDQSNRGLRGLL